jgi:hypothetical protein
MIEGGAMRKMLAKVLVLVMWLAGPAQAFAQDDVEAELREVPNVLEVALPSLAAEGPVRAAIRREGARLAQDPAPIAPQRSWISQHPVIAGTLIGSGVGAVLSQTDSVGGGSHDPRVILIGSGGGALAGLVASAIQKRRADQKLGVGTKIVLVSSVLGAVTLTLMCASYCGGN